MYWIAWLRVIEYALARTNDPLVHRLWMQEYVFHICNGRDGLFGPRPEYTEGGA